MKLKIPKKLLTVLLSFSLILLTAGVTLAAWNQYTESNDDISKQIGNATLDGADSNWQGFMPSGNLLEKVSVYFGRVDGEEVKVSIYDVNGEPVVSAQGQLPDLNGAPGWKEYDFSSHGPIPVEKGGRYTIRVSNVSLNNRGTVPLEHQVLYWPYTNDEYDSGYAVMDGDHKYSNDFLFKVNGFDCLETCEWYGYECGTHEVCGQWTDCGACGDGEECVEATGKCQLVETGGEDSEEESEEEESTPPDEQEDSSETQGSDSSDSDTDTETVTVTADASEETSDSDEDQTETTGQSEESEGDEDSDVESPILEEVFKNDEVVDLEEVVGALEIEEDDYVTLFGTATAGATISVDIGDIPYLTTANDDGEWSLDILAADLSDGTYEVSGYVTTEDGNSEAVEFLTLQKGEVSESEVDAQSEKTISLVAENDGVNTMAIVLIVVGAAGVIISLFLIIKRNKKKKEVLPEDTTGTEVDVKEVAKTSNEVMGHQVDNSTE